MDERSRTKKQFIAFSRFISLESYGWRRRSRHNNLMARSFSSHGQKYRRMQFDSDHHWIGNVFCHTQVMKNLITVHLKSGYKSKLLHAPLLMEETAVLVGVKSRNDWIQKLGIGAGFSLAGELFFGSFFKQRRKKELKPLFAETIFSQPHSFFSLLPLVSTRFFLVLKQSQGRPQSLQDREKKVATLMSDCIEEKDLISGNNSQRVLLQQQKRKFLMRAWQRQQRLVRVISLFRQISQREKKKCSKISKEGFCCKKAVGQFKTRKWPARPKKARTREGS